MIEMSWVRFTSISCTFDGLELRARSLLWQLHLGTMQSELFHYCDAPFI